MQWDFQLNEYSIVEISVYPNMISTQFDKRISDMSSNFVMIFEQAEIANLMGLDSVTGIAYRKAFEFLICDYAIYKEPKKEEEISKAKLADVIKKFFNDDDSLQNIFRKITWLGNDQVHFHNKHPEYDVSDLKRFIQAAVSQIVSQLDLKDLDEVPPR